MAPGGQAACPGELLAGTLCRTGHVLSIWPGLNEQGLSKHRPEHSQLWAHRGFGQHKPVLTQQRQSPPAPLPHGRTSGQLQSEETGERGWVKINHLVLTGLFQLRSVP